MASNDSSTGGYLLPVGDPAPGTDDLDLDLIFQASVAGITGLPGAMVRPSFQEDPPTRPPAKTDWCAVSVSLSTPDANVYEKESADGKSQLQVRHETLEVMTSFYGPNAITYARRLRAGLANAQNREPLTALSIGFVETHEIRRVPELVNNKWIQRRDMQITFRRKVTETYAVLDFPVAGVHTFDDTYGVDHVIPAPPGTAVTAVEPTDTNPAPQQGT